MIKTATPARATATPLNDLAESGMNCQTPQRSAPDAPQTPLYYVRRTVSKPLPQRDAVAVAAEMKARLARELVAKGN
jgi:hypothetical protein